MIEISLETIYNLLKEQDVDNKELLQSINEKMEHIEELTETQTNYTELTYKSIKNIETFNASFFVITLLALLSTIVIKTFFTGW